MAFPCLRWAHLPLCTLSCTLQTSLDSFVSHPSLDKHRQEMNVVLQWFTPYWKHLLSKKSIESSFGFTCLLFSLALADMYLFIGLFPTSETHLTKDMFDFGVWVWRNFHKKYHSQQLLFNGNYTKLKSCMHPLSIFNFVYFLFFISFFPPLHFSLLRCRIPHFSMFLPCSAIFISGKSKCLRAELKPCSTAG